MTPSQTSLIRPVVLNATIPLPNEKGIILTTASLTVVGLSFQGATIEDSLGGNGVGIRDQNTGPGARLTVLSSTFMAIRRVFLLAMTLMKPSPSKTLTS